TVGAVSSLTVNVVLFEQMTAYASSTCLEFRRAPFRSSVPAAGDWLNVIPLVPPQLSLALTPPNTSGTAARQLVPALVLLGAGQRSEERRVGKEVSAGGQAAQLVDASVAVHVITGKPNP